MKCIILFGPPAVGKMTVGQELERITGLKLFHNHMSIELVVRYFDFSTPPFNRLTTLIRKEILREIAHSDLEGVIFTFVWALDLPKEYDYVDELIAPFVEVGAEIYYVELEADLEERIRRNTTENRLTHKATKRNTEQSLKSLLHEHENFRENSDGDFPRSNHLKINNTHLSAEEVAKKIEAFIEGG